VHDGDILILNGDLQQIAIHMRVKQRQIQQTLTEFYLNNSLASQNTATFRDSTVYFCQHKNFVVEKKK
jgi:hypothetical protein